VQFWDAETGEPRRYETVQDRWLRVDRFDLPKSHTVTNATGAGFSARSLTLSKHRLCDTKAATPAR
jgi:hypothetical protein